MNYDRKQSLLSKEERKKLLFVGFWTSAEIRPYLWLKRKKETGDFAAINNKSGGKKPKIKDWGKFEQFVLKHNQKTQIQIAQLWGDNLTQQNVSKACQKLGITRKKTYGYQERNEEQRQKFREKVSTVDKNN